MMFVRSWRLLVAALGASTAIPQHNPAGHVQLNKANSPFNAPHNLSPNGWRAENIKPGMRLLVSIANYGNFSSQTFPVFKLMENLVDLCNHAVNVSVHMDVSDPEWFLINRIDTGQFYCERTQSRLPMDVVLHNPKIGFGLTGLHRAYWHTHFDEFDWFMYTEHDIDFTAANFIHLMSEFVRLQGTTYMPGLLRYEHLKIGKYDTRVLTDMRGEWSNSEATQRRILCKGNNPFVRGTMNLNEREYMKPVNGYQGYFIVPRSLLEPVINNSGWYRPDWPKTLGREVFSSFWLFGPCNYDWCKQPFTKVVPLEDVDGFMTHHMSNKYGYNEAFRLPHGNPGNVMDYRGRPYGDRIQPFESEILGLLGFCRNGTRDTEAMWEGMGFPKVPQGANRVAEVSRVFQRCANADAGGVGGLPKC